LPKSKAEIIKQSNKRFYCWFVPLILGVSLLGGFRVYMDYNIRSEYIKQLTQGDFPVELIKRIYPTKCQEGAIKQKITIDDKTYCVFATSDEKKPYTSEPYSDKCECK
jgi:hypothetical protein